MSRQYLERTFKMNVEKVNIISCYDDENFLVRNKFIFKIMKYFEHETDQFIQKANKEMYSSEISKYFAFKILI